MIIWSSCSIVPLLFPLMKTFPSWARPGWLAKWQTHIHNIDYLIHLISQAHVQLVGEYPVCALMKLPSKYFFPRTSCQSIFFLSNLLPSSPTISQFPWNNIDLHLWSFLLLDKVTWKCWTCKCNAWSVAERITFTVEFQDHC